MTGVILKYFMWQWQHHFPSDFSISFKMILEKLGIWLPHRIFLLGVREEGNKNRHPVCIEPSEIDKEVDLSAFETTLSEAQELYNERGFNQMFYGLPEHERNATAANLNQCYQDVVQRKLDAAFDTTTWINVLAWPVVVDGYRVTVVLQIESTRFVDYYALNKKYWYKEDPDTIEWNPRLERSFVESVTTVFLKECSRALAYDPNDPNASSMRETDEQIRHAGVNFMHTPNCRAGGRTPSFGLFAGINSISSMFYEGAAGRGRLVLCQADHENIEIEIRLKEPVRLRDHRAVRKLLELAEMPLAAFCDGEEIYGFGKLKDGYQLEQENLFVVDFTGHFRWQVSHDGNVMMIAEYGMPGLPKPPVDHDLFRDNFEAFFGDDDGTSFDSIWAIITEASRQKHGTMIVISPQADAESARLSGQAILVEPFRPDPSQVAAVTTIDGAVLVDPNGICHAIGVILDGTVCSKGSMSRGARYNSAIRYVEGRQGQFRTFAVIVSEDGMIDVYPPLRPRVSKKEILDRIVAFQNLIKSDPLPQDKIEQELRWFDKRRVYLSPSMCADLQNAKTVYLSKREMEEHRMYVQYGDFKPSEYFDEVYYLP